MIQGGVVILLIVMALALGFGMGWLRRDYVFRQALPGGGTNDPLLREAEAEVEALLSALPLDEQPKKRLALLPPATRPKHPRLTEMQRRAIAGLLHEGAAVEEIQELHVDALLPPSATKPAYWFWWAGSVFVYNGKRAGGKWGKAHAISSETWAYVRRVITKLPNHNHNWVFQYRDGKQVSYADVLTCAGEEPDA